MWNVERLLLVLWCVWCVGKAVPCHGPDETCGDDDPSWAVLDQGRCMDGYVECRSGNTCVARHAVCDGQAQCLDRSDEVDCSRRGSAVPTTASPEPVDEEVGQATSQEELIASDEATGGEFRLDDDADHCRHYGRMIVLARRVDAKLSKLPPKLAKQLRFLVDEILMEANMESFQSLLQLHQVCGGVTRRGEQSKHEEEQHRNGENQNHDMEPFNERQQNRLNHHKLPHREEHYHRGMQHHHDHHKPHHHISTSPSTVI